MLLSGFELCLDGGFLLWALCDEIARAHDAEVAELEEEVEDEEVVLPLIVLAVGGASTWAIEAGSASHHLLVKAPAGCDSEVNDAADSWLIVAGGEEDGVVEDLEVSASVLLEDGVAVLGVSIDVLGAYASGDEELSELPARFAARVKDERLTVAGVLKPCVDYGVPVWLDGFGHVLLVFGSAFGSGGVDLDGAGLDGDRDERFEVDELEEVDLGADTLVKAKEAFLVAPAWSSCDAEDLSGWEIGEDALPVGGEAEVGFVANDEAELVLVRLPSCGVLHRLDASDDDVGVVCCSVLALLAAWNDARAGVDLLDCLGDEFISIRVE